MVKRPEKPPIKPPQPDLGVQYDLPISQEKLIGRVVVEWAKLEGALDDIIWRFLNIPMEYGRIVTSRMDANAKIAMIRSLNLLGFDPSTYDYLLNCYLKEILDHIDILRESRNLIVHGTWGRSLPDKIPIAMSLRIKDTPSTIVSETFPSERMRVILHDTVALKWKIVSLLNAASASHDRAKQRFPTG